ncbi:MAG: shikimate kinase [Acidimicrobiia bacterium]
MLVGLMGAGKTTAGRLVAHRLGLEFRDNDEALAARTGLTAAELTARDGMAALHDAELESLLVLLGTSEPLVIAAAASTIEARACREALELSAFVAWLHADVTVLAERASRGHHRALARDVHAQLAAHAAHRCPLYRAVADVSIDVGIHDPDTAARRIIDALRDGARTEAPRRAE